MDGPVLDRSRPDGPFNITT